VLFFLLYNLSRALKTLLFDEKPCLKEKF